MNYEEKILIYLVENYRKSKKDLGDNKTNRRTQVKPEKIYKKYNANNGDFEEISALNQAVQQLIKKGFISVEIETFGTQIQRIYFVDNMIQEAEKYLENHYGYLSKDTKLETLQKLINTYQNKSFICTKECEALSEKMEKRQVPKDVDELEDILKTIAFIENNKEELYIREVSMKVYGDSKYFEEKMLQPVCNMLRKYTEDNTNNTSLTDEILVNYHIYKEPQKLCIKGKVVLQIEGKEIDISALDGGIEFQASELWHIQSIKLISPIFMTVENKTSYLRYKAENTVVFYLGGYANRQQRDFIKLVCACNPNARYMHFGDIDAGGLWIHNHLCKITEKKFELFCMSVKELQNSAYKSCLHPLTENDRSRMQGLKDILEYKEVVEYMLEHNVKLEQEIVSLYLMQKVDLGEENS